MKQGAEAIVYMGYGYSTFHFARAFKALDWDPPRFMGTAFMFYSNSNAWAEGLEGWHGVDQLGEDGTNPNYEAMLERFTKRFGRTSRNVVVALAYDTARAAIHGIANALHRHSRPRSRSGSSASSGCRAPTAVRRTYLTFAPYDHRGYKGDFLTIRELRGGELHFRGYYRPSGPPTPTRRSCRPEAELHPPDGTRRVSGVGHEGPYPGGTRGRKDMNRVAPESGSARREQRRVEHQDLSRAQLLDAAEEVFGRKGFYATTLKEVAELAGFSVGSVYSFFANKDDLFRQVYLRRGDEFMPLLRSIIDSRAPAIEVLHDVVRFQVQFFRDHPNFGRLYLWHSGHVFGSDASPPVDPAIVANFEEAMVLQAQLFARGQRAGDLRRGDPEVLSRLLSGLVGAYQEMDPAVVGGDSAASERLSLDDLLDLAGRAFAA